MTKGQGFLLAVAFLAGLYGEATENFLLAAIIVVPAIGGFIGIWVHNDKQKAARNRAEMRRASNNY